MKPIVAEGRSLVMKFDEVHALRGVHFQIREGESYGFYGDMGSGKTTLLKIFCGLLTPTAGELFINGLSIKTNLEEIKSKISFSPAYDDFDEEFDVLDNLLVYASYHRIGHASARRRIKHLLRVFEAENITEQKFSALDPFSQKKIKIVRALLNTPSLLLLDEPTSYLKPYEQHFIWTKLNQEKPQDCTTILATTHWEEVEENCSQVMILHKGATVVKGKPPQLVYENIGTEMVEFVGSKQEIDYLLTKFEGRYEYVLLGDRVKLFIKDGQDGKQAINTICSDHILVRKANLSDVYFKLVGNEVRL